MAVGGTLLKGNKYAYIIVEYNMEEDNDFKNEYTKIVMAIREVFKNSVLPSSDRWYLETQSLELACGRCPCNITSDAGLWCESDLCRGWNRFI